MQWIRLLRGEERVEGRVIYVLALVILVQTIYPITADGSIGSLLIYEFLYAMLVISGILVAQEYPRTKHLLMALGALWLFFGVLYAFNTTLMYLVILTFIVIGLFQLVVIKVFVKFIFLSRQVTRDVLYAAIAVYMMIGGVFGVLYGLIEFVTWSATGSGAFIDGTAGIIGQPLPWQTTLYYSYATLTTLGYGDILPLTMWARSIVSLEAVIGVMYTTIIMARLVGVYASDKDIKLTSDRMFDDPMDNVPYEN